jgi:hypothetical protein
MFGIHLLTVYADSEYPAGTGYEFNPFNLSAKFLSQFVLQTGGSGLVVSRCAIFNGDFHRFLLVVKKREPVWPLFLAHFFNQLAVPRRKGKGAQLVERNPFVLTCGMEDRFC